MLLIVIFLSLLLGILYLANRDKREVIVYENIKPAIIKPEIIHLGFVGDMMLDRSVKISIMKNGGGDYHFPFAKIQSTLDQFDWLFGNLEGPVSDKKNICGSIYSFQMATTVPSVLADVGFDAVSVANNHMMDYCQSAFVDTLKRLASSSLEYVGGGNNYDEAYTVKSFEVKKLKVAVMAFSDFGKTWTEKNKDEPGVAKIDQNKICQMVQDVRPDNDLVVVSLHMGDEYKTESNTYQKTVAEKAIDCGADIIVGHHPHVSEPLVQYKDGWITYSLGNFVFDQPFSEETMKGNILNVVVEGKKLKTVEYWPYKLNSFYQPELVKESN
ncbi:MAG: CapA family protein [bacterium]